MTTQLAIGYLSTPRRGNGSTMPGTPRSAHVTEHDSISARPPIPRAVISWTASDLRQGLPAGAGDPAVAIDGPPPFQALAARTTRRLARVSADAAMLGGLSVLLLGLAAAVVTAGDQATSTWTPSDPLARVAGTPGKVPVVDVQVERVEISAPSSRATTRLATAAKPAAAN